MSVRPEILLLIALCMVVTVIPRVLPMALVNHLRLPPWFLAWLRHIPAAVIAALFFRETLLTGGEFRHWGDPYLLAGLLTLAAAFLFRNIFATVAIGGVLYAALRALLG